MALTTPFINGVSAFDATIGTTVYVNVLGGDAISSVSYSIYDNNNNIVYSKNTSVADNQVSDIRTFAVTIPASSTSTLANNFQYKIRVRTSDGTNYSNYSQDELFVCYVSPSFSFSYYNGSSFVPLNNGFTIPSVNLDVELVFNTNDAQSPAVLNDAHISVYGIDSNSIQTLVFQGEPLYVSPLEQTLSGFVPTSGTYAQYSKYLIVATGKTVDGFEFTSQVSNLNCSYNISVGSILQLTNFCNTGLIEIKSTYTSSTTIASYDLQFKTSNSADWVTFMTDTNPNDGTDAWLNFIIDFPFCANNMVYDFRIVLYATNNSVVASDIVQVLSKFGKSFICDGRNIYDITKEWTIGSYSIANPTAVYQPFSSQYPIITKNALTQYRSGQYTAVLLAPTSQSTRSAYIDRNAQTNLKFQFESWLSNGSTKIIKDFNGSIIIVAIINEVPSSYYQKLGNGIASSTFNWVEVGDFEQESFDYLGLTNSFDINYYL